MFFADENRRKVIRTFLESVQEKKDDLRGKRLSIAKKILESINAEPQEWDNRCGFNISHIGDQFLSFLRDFDGSRTDHIDRIYCTCYRFLCEFDFMIGSGQQLGFDLADIKKQIINDMADMDEMNRSQIIYASYVMPANIMKELLTRTEIDNFVSF
jgi:hypothetical protein